MSKYSSDDEVEDNVYLHNLDLFLRYFWQYTLKLVTYCDERPNFRNELTQDLWFSVIVFLFH